MITQLVNMERGLYVVIMALKFEMNSIIIILVHPQENSKEN